jgi:predicted ABC-type ATPase
LGTILDPDAIARERTPDDPSKSAIFAARTVLTALANGLERGSRMVYETTLSDKNRHLELIAQAKAREFEVWCCTWVWTCLICTFAACRLG